MYATEKYDNFSNNILIMLVDRGLSVDDQYRNVVLQTCTYYHTQKTYNY